MRLRKLFITVLFAVILVIQAVGFGWSIIEADAQNVVVYALQSIYAVYVLAVSAAAINETYSAHARAMVHLSALTFAAVLLLGATAILPSKPLPSVSVFRASSAPLGLWYAVLGLYAICMAISATTPRGPALHFPSEQIYSDKTLMQITSRYEDNVCGVTGMFVLPFISPILSLVEI